MKLLDLIEMALDKLIWTEWLSAIAPVLCWFAKIEGSFYLLLLKGLEKVTEESRDLDSKTDFLCCSVPSDSLVPTDKVSVTELF